VAGTHEVPGGAEERDWIHSRMSREILVLKADGRVDEGGRDIVKRRPDAVFLIWGERDPEDVAVSIAHPRGEIESAGERWFGEDKPENAREEDESCNCNEPSTLPRSGGFPTAE